MVLVARPYEQKATIANGATTSNAVPASPGQVTGIRFGTFTGATVSFTTCSTIDGTFVAVHNSSGLYTVTATDDRVMTVDPLVSQAFLKYVKVVSASSEGAERDVYLVIRDWI